MSVKALRSMPLERDWVAETILPIEFRGREVMFEARAYQGGEPSEQAIALIHRKADIEPGTAPLVRVHSGCVTGDIFHSLRCDCYPQLQASLARIIEAPLGALIYLPYHEGRGIGLVDKIRAYALQDAGRDTVDANLELGAPIDARDYRLAAEILAELGFQGVRLLTNNPAKAKALEAQGIEVTERVGLVVAPSRHNRRYLDTKRRRMQHDV